MPETTKEVLTRRKEQNIIEQTKNSQIDQNKLIEKKDILITKIEENLKIKDDILKLQRDAMSSLKESQPGYIHFIETVNLPDPDVYEPDDDDIEFLKKHFSKDFKTVSGPSSQIFGSQIFVDFGKLIEYVENTRDFTFGKIKLTGSKFTPDILEKVIEYWKSRTTKFKRPLLRKFWKPNIKKSEFGELDPLKVAFREREKERMRLRKILKLTDQEIYEKLEELKEEAQISEKMSRLILKREQLKLFTLQTSGAKDEALTTPTIMKPDFLVRCKNDIDQAESIIKKYTIVIPPPELPKPEITLPPPVIQEPIVKIQKPIDNDIACFISTLISELHVYGFDLNDFKCENIKVLNDKIRKIKRNAQTSNSFERTISFLPKLSTIVLPEIETFDLFKRHSNTLPGSIFLEKVERHADKPSNLSLYDERNFTSDHLVKRNFEIFQNDFSHFQIPPASGLNPFVYCGANNYSTNNELLEAAKIRKYNRLLGVSDCSTELLPSTDHSLNNDTASLTNIAEQELKNMKLELRFKSFRAARA